MLSSSLGNPAILSSVGARLLLNMKEAGTKGLNEGLGSNAARATISGIDFGMPPVRPSSISGTEGGEERYEEMEMAIA